ncbi:multisubunit sodium/proton antiporter MrpC subunit [Aliiruegeria haliotis]|uniref:Multisubunit sodium/proton antiporter MrpC subunit n=1 Tax=Aliiruegeria haliotis TaxID=1280846 RepID=A0A2T0RLV0_9RHOB|nr:NADH-quinone oxidoreductase subunit K [Aliiruegeria haliotis]PRY22100.1 multisubunit sodium/proton antiporter MrpC subunit [Aliiruegeria haliotis]
MISEYAFLATGAGLVGLALLRLATSADLLMRVLGLNVLAVGIAMLLLVSGMGASGTDAVPQAFVLTGIVVLVGVTAVLLALAERIAEDRDE